MLVVILLFVALTAVSLGIGMLAAARHYYDDFKFGSFTPDEMVILIIIGVLIDIVLVINIGSQLQ